MKDAAPSWGVPSEVVARIVGSPAGRLAGEERDDAEVNNIMRVATERRVSERASSQSVGASRVFIE